MDAKLVKPGTKVRIVDRDPTSADAKSRLFYPHFRNLTGTVQRVFADGEEVEVVVDLDSLPEDIRSRHLSAQDAMRKRIAESLSGEARERAGSEAERLNLRYSILVSPKDLVPITEPAEGPASSSKAKRKTEDAAGPRSAEAAAEPSKQAKPRAAATGPPAPPQPRTRRPEQRITEQDLSRKEEELLKRKQRAKR